MFQSPSNLWTLAPSRGTKSVPLGTYTQIQFERLVWMLVLPWPSPGAYADFGLVDNHRLIGRASTVEPGAGITFELTRNQGAALITKHPTYQEDIERELIFEDYIKKHYQSWVDFSRESGHGRDIQPVLVTGVDLTREFATVAYSDNRTRMECKFSAVAPTVASASASVWGSWRAEGLVHTNCGPHIVHTIQGDRRSSEGSALVPTIPDEYNQCVFIRYYTIRRRLFIPTVIKAGAGPHQLPKSDPGSDSPGEEGLQPSSDDDSAEEDPAEEDLSEYRPPDNAFDEVIHNIPLVCPKCHPRLPPLTNWTKDDRDGFDIVAEFIFQVGNTLLCMSGSEEQTQLNRDPRRNRYYCTTMTSKTFSRYVCTLALIPRSRWLRRVKKKQCRCSLSPGRLKGSRLTKTEVNRSRSLHC